MNLIPAQPAPTESLMAVGLPDKEVKAWLRDEPKKPGRYSADCKSFGAFWKQSSGLLRRLQPPSSRQQRERRAAGTILDIARESRVRFLRAHADTVYDALTAKRSRFVRLEELVPARRKAAAGPVAVARGYRRREGPAAEQEGRARNRPGSVHLGGAAQRAVRAGICATPCCCRAGSARHCCRNSSSREQPQFPGASIERRGKAAIVTFENPRFLNAEDQTTLAGMETLRRSRVARRTGSRSRCCAAARSSIRSTRTAACSARASTSRTSITAASRSSGISSATSATSTSSIAAWRFEDQPPPDEFGGSTHREALDRRGRDPSPSAATARSCSRSTTCSPRRPRS